MFNSPLIPSLPRRRGRVRTLQPPYRIHPPRPGHLGTLALLHRGARPAISCKRRDRILDRRRDCLTRGHQSRRQRSRRPPCPRDRNHLIPLPIQVFSLKFTELDLKRLAFAS